MLHANCKIRSTDPALNVGLHVMFHCQQPSQAAMKKLVKSHADPHLVQVLEKHQWYCLLWMYSSSCGKLCRKLHATNDSFKQLQIAPKPMTAPALGQGACLSWSIAVRWACRKLQELLTGRGRMERMAAHRKCLDWICSMLSEGRKAIKRNGIGTSMLHELRCNSFVMAILQSHVLIQLQAVAMKILEISRNSTSDSEKDNKGKITHWQGKT